MGCANISRVRFETLDFTAEESEFLWKGIGENDDGIMVMPDDVIESLTEEDKEGKFANAIGKLEAIIEKEGMVDLMFSYN